MISLSKPGRNRGRSRGTVRTSSSGTSMCGHVLSSSPIHPFSFLRRGQPKRCDGQPNIDIHWPAPSCRWNASNSFMTDTANTPARTSVTRLDLSSLVSRQLFTCTLMGRKPLPPNSNLTSNISENARSPFPFLRFSHPAIPLLSHTRPASRSLENWRRVVAPR